MLACWWNGHADDSISTLHPKLYIIVGKLCIVVCWWNGHADGSIFTLHPALKIIGGELCIMAYSGMVMLMVSSPLSILHWKS